ncbi:AGE family epimerase/isomerase [Pseudomonadota bacterium AL_CKDN230030165-1A_HGKHYDSX7]
MSLASPSPSSTSALTTLIAALRQHYAGIVLPPWRAQGWNAALNLAHESLDGHSAQPLPDIRYRAMACARQLYVHATDPSADAGRHAGVLFESLQKHFINRDHGGWYYSVDAAGAPLDTAQDLYTHAFVVFACAAWAARSQSVAARKLMVATAERIESQFRRADGHYVAALDGDWGKVLRGPAQNPVMHLTEAYLAAAAVAEPARFALQLRRIAQDVADLYLHGPTLCIAEAPVGTPGNRIEPGHQFEWYALVTGSPEVFSGLELEAATVRGAAWARLHGVRDDTAAVVAALDLDGGIADPVERIWAQTEYTRYLALLGEHEALARQLDALRRRFLHERGWHECLNPDGAVVRADMPATTPYHLATGYAALPLAV